MFFSRDDYISDELLSLLDSIDSNIAERQGSIQQSTNGVSTNMSSSVTNTNTVISQTSTLAVDLNEEPNQLEVEQHGDTIVSETYFETTWTQELESETRSPAEYECYTDSDDFLANDIQFQEAEFNPDQYSDLEEEFAVDDDPYGMTSRSIPVPILEAIDSNEFYVGQVFPSRQEFKDALVRHAMFKNIRYNPVDTRLNRIKAICFNQPCTWRVVARGDAEFTVTKYVQEHQCCTVRQTSDHNACTSSFVASQIEEQFVASEKYNPRCIQRDMKARYGVCISYKKAYMAREKALKKVVGDYDQAYRDLPMYLRELRFRDPDTYVALHRNGDNNFQRCFWAFGACGRVFRAYLRKLIGIDATHLSGKYPGVLLMATSIDANCKILPVCFAIAEVECAAAWEWFLDHVKKFLNVEPQFLSIVSDRHRGILSAVRKVYPTAHHAFCCYHLACNMVTDTRDRRALGLFWAAARANTPIQYARAMQSMLERHPDVHRWLQNIDPKRWANAHFTGRRYSMLTTNCSESLNGLFKEARELPINGLIDRTRRKIAQWFFNRMQESSKCNGHLTPYASQLIAERRQRIRECIVHPFSHNEMEVQTPSVTYIVDLEKHTCDCGEFQISGIPCTHAIAAITHRNMDPARYVEFYFESQIWKATYKDRIYPCRSKQFWPIHENDITVLPPRSVVQPGRRKKARIESRHNGRIKNRCSRCKQLGHNKRSCRMPPAQTTSGSYNSAVRPC